MTTTHTLESVKTLLLRSNAAVERAMVVLYALQTTDERRAGDTKYDNDRGFNCFNAPAGTAFARWILGHDWNGDARYEPKHLTHPNAGYVLGKYSRKSTPVERARKIALLHAGQLLAVANGELEVPEGFARKAA